MGRFIYPILRRKHYTETLAAKNAQYISLKEDNTLDKQSYAAHYRKTESGAESDHDDVDTKSGSGSKNAFVGGREEEIDKSREHAKYNQKHIQASDTHRNWGSDGGFKLFKEISVQRHRYCHTRRDTDIKSY